MAIRLVTSTVFDFDMFDARAKDDKGPRHTVQQLARKLDAEIHQPERSRISLVDRLLSRLYAFPEHWGLARHLSRELHDEDIVYCSGQDVGLPIAILAKLRNSRARIAVSTMDPGSRRFGILVTVFRLNKSIKLFTVNDKFKKSILQDKFRIPSNRILVLPEQTDAEFFRPCAGTMAKSRPILASAGLEQRDYATLARAVEDLDVDLKICAFSPNASTKQVVAMPDKTPKNMEMKFYEFAELRNLYCSADLVVVSLLKNDYSAGLTVLMEAMACRRPIVITRNSGLSKELADKGVVLGTEPGNSDSLRSSIVSLLDNRSQAEALAEKGHQHFLQHHTSEVYVSLIYEALSAL